MALSLSAAVLLLARAAEPARRRRQGLQAGLLTVALWAAWAAGLLPWEWRVLTAGYYAYAHLYAGTHEAADGPLRREVRLARDCRSGPGRARGGRRSVPTRRRADAALLEEGALAQVAVVDDGGVRSLLINGKADASSGAGDMRTQLLLGHLPVLLAPDDPGGEALVVGLGSGVTAGAVASWPFEGVTVAEIEPAVARASRWFVALNRDVLADPRVALRADDGRRVLARTAGRLGLITSEPSNLWMSGVTLLFTREFFELAAERLGPRGVLCQWLHLYQVGVETSAACSAPWPGASLPARLRRRNRPPGGRRGSPLELDPRPLAAAARRQPGGVAGTGRVGIGSARDLAAGFVADERGIGAWTGRRRPAHRRPAGARVLGLRAWDRDRSGPSSPRWSAAGVAAGRSGSGAVGEVGPAALH